MKVMGAVSLFVALSLAPVGQAAAASLAAPNRVVVDESMSDRAIDLDTQSLLVVRLPVIPSSGYRWELENPSEVAPVLRQVNLSPLGKDAPDYEYEGELMPGGQAFQRLHFVGARNGSADLRVALRRPWDRSPRGLDQTMRFSVRSNGAFTGVLPQVAPAAVKPTTPVAFEEVYAPGLPAHFDWRELNGVTPIRDQGQCGSCWAFGATAILESKVKIKKGLDRDYAEQYYVSCNMNGFSCAGGWWAHDYAWMKSIPGEPGGGGRLESDFPYEAADLPCNPPHTPYEQIEGWAYVDDVPDGAVPTVTHKPTVAQIKEKIYNYGPVGTVVCCSTWGSYTGGIMRSDCSTGNHIVAITGWDDAEGVFYIKNSWGTSWGESGYMRLPYGMCVVGEDSTYLLYEKTNPRIRYRSDTFFEDKPNQGGIYNSLEARIEDSTTSTRFAMTSGTLTQGTHYTVSNLPAGLTLRITATSATTAMLSISGQAPAHANANDVSNLTVAFANAAFTGGSAAAVGDSTYAKLKINFNDPYRFIYYDVADVWVDHTSPWQFYWLEGSDYQYGFGLWYYIAAYLPDPNDRTLKFESYTKPVLSRNLTLPPDVRNLAYGEEIGPNSTIWARGGSYGDQHTIAGPTNTVFNGRIGYVGFSFEYNGWPVYGWVRVEVDSSGSYGRILDYAWNQDPNKSVRAGYTTDTSAPVASFAGTPTTVQQGGSVQFTDQSSGTPTSWSWSFSGGTPSTSTSQNPRVTYNTAGTYNVSLTVRNSYGSNTMTKNGYITVTGACSYSISPTSTTVAAAGSTGNVSVTATSGCPWTAVSNVSWVTVTSGTSGTGNGTVGYSVAANSSTASRTGTVTIAGRTFTVTQSGTSGCTYTINPTSSSFTRSGGTGSVSVTTNTGCTWTARSNVSWVRVTSGASGSGSGTVRYSVSTNTGTSSRTGTVTIAGNTFTVTQSGTSTCTYSISPTSASYTGEGGSGTVAVTTTSGCTWTAVSNVSWAAVTSGASGSGSGTVAYSVAANTASTSRTGTITIAGNTFTVTQTGSSSNCTTYTGSLSSTGDYDYQPNGNWYYSSRSGTHSATLTGPAGTNFDAELWKTVNGAWALVARTSGSTSNESVSYSGTAGYYYWRVISISGSGAYTICISYPQ